MPAPLCALLLTAGAATAGAWPTEPGRGQVIVTTTADVARRSFDDDGRPADRVAYDKREAAVFVEYGLTRRLTLVGRAAYQDVTIETGAGRDAATGWGAAELGLRAVLVRRRADVLSVQGAVIVPGAVENVADLYLGEGGRDAEARVLYGRALGASGYVEAQGGWRWRSGPPPDEARLDLTLGWRRGRWEGAAQAFALHATGASGARRNYDSLKLQFSASRKLNSRMRVQAGVFRTVAGRTIVRETGVFSGVWLSF